MIIVTGGAGFIGSAFVWKLNTQGISDIVIVDRLGTTDKWKNLVNRRYSDVILKDDFLYHLDDKNKNFRATAVVHMGACSSTTERDADYLLENNFHYTMLLAQFCRKNKIPFIYASSAATYGDGDEGFSDDHVVCDRLKPLNMYGYSKQMFDLWAIKNRCVDHMVGVKFFNVFGPNEYHKAGMISMAHRAFHQIQETGRVRLFKSYNDKYRDGEQLRDFVYVKDCVEVLWWFFQNPAVGGIFNLGTGRARSWNDLANAIFAAMGKTPQIDYIDMPVELRDRYQYFTEADMTKLKAAGCNHAFASLEESVKDYVQKYLAGGEKTL